jgi:benzodiazapine receptor
MNTIFYLATPSIVIYSVFYFVNINCKTFEQDSRLRFQPPGYVFSIVWPILLLLLGYSWNRFRNLIHYPILLLLLSTWMLLYLCLEWNKISLVLLLSTVYLVHRLLKKTKDVVLYPLFIWLLFASFLNFQKTLVIRF